MDIFHIIKGLNLVDVIKLNLTSCLFLFSFEKIISKSPALITCISSCIMKALLSKLSSFCLYGRYLFMLAVNFLIP